MDICSKNIESKNSQKIKENRKNIYTSYFAKTNKLLDKGLKNLISIAGKCPDDFLINHYCTQYKKLAPKYIWWKEWHDNNLSNEWYIEKYNETVLNLLDPNQIFFDLTKNNTEDAVILCWECPNKFCHRHLIAEWLMKHLKIEITEI